MKVLWRCGVILLTLQPEQSVGVGSIPGGAPLLERYDTGRGLD